MKAETKKDVKDLAKYTAKQTARAVWHGLCTGVMVGGAVVLFRSYK